MKDKIDALFGEIEQFAIQNKEQLEAFRIRFLGTKNVIKDIFTDLKNVAPELRKEVGQHINSLKFSVGPQKFFLKLKRCCSEEARSMIHLY